MDCKNLMIGDWVTLNYEGVKKVVRILRLHQHYADVITENDTEIDSVAYSLLEGISLTEEILKANGFKQMLNGKYIDTNEDGFSVCIWVVANFPQGVLWKLEVFNDGSIKKNIIYIHQLQHALSLCGLNELADNFKIR